MRTHQRRTKRLVDTRLQLKLTVYFACLVIAALLFQFVLFASTMSDSAARFSETSSTLYEEFRHNLLLSLAYSIAVVLPLTLAIGILVTFRIAGPVHRIKEFLRSVAGGEAPADCQLREGDELKDLCTLANEATAPLRTRSESEDGESRAVA